MDAKQYRRDDRRSLWHPYTRRSAMEAGPFPIIARGEGVYLFDLEGRRYFDAVSSWWCCNLGHNHPALVEAIVRQARELQHSILGSLSHPRAIELAARLAGLFPAGRWRVFFASDGASAVEAALKIAVQYWFNTGHPERRKFAALEQGYHGDTLGAVSVGYLDDFHRPFKPLLFKTCRAPSPCCATCRFGPDASACGEKCFEPMGEIIEEHSPELAAVIVEPMCQGAAGMRIYSAGYLRKLAALCREHGILLIADEIAMGFGRTGRMFAFEHAGISPDIVCLGKGLSGGYLPLSATVVREEIFETFRDKPKDRTFYHGHTFAGNPIACAAALATLEVYGTEKIVARSARTGRMLAGEMKALEGLKGVANVRCLGMVGAAELQPMVKRGVSLAQRVRRRLFEKGVLVRPLGNVVYLVPPLVTPEKVLAEAVDILAHAVEQG